MSRALKSLRDAGLVSQTHPPHDTRLRIYELQVEPMREMKQWLETTESLWSQQLLAFKVHLESGR